MKKDNNFEQDTPKIDQEFLNQIHATNKLDLVSVIAKIPVPVALVQHDGVFISANQLFADIYESDALYLLGKKLGFVSTTVYQLFQDALQLFRNDSRLYKIENEFYSKGHFFQIYFSALRDKSSSLDCVLIVCADITKLKRRERVLIQNNKRLFEELYLDPVTGMNNKLAFEQFLKDRFLIQERKNYSFIKFEVENFKKFNQLNSYTIGDEILSRIGSLIKEELNQDLAEVYRLNSASFILVIQESTPWKILTIAERLKQTLVREKIYFDPQKDEVLTCAIGIFHPNCQKMYSEKQILETLDRAVDIAHVLGRNSIHVLDE